MYKDTAPLTTVFGWNTVINLFYIPGTMLGAPASDWLGPRYALALGVFLQAVIGFIMAGDYFNLSQPSMIGGFVVVYGVFLALGEFGPGNNIGLLAAKTCATGIRGEGLSPLLAMSFSSLTVVCADNVKGKYYGIAAAIGKIGAFVGTWGRSSGNRLERHSLINISQSFHTSRQLAATT